MQINIDTQRDSPEELRKLIRLLSALIGDSPPASGMLDSALTPATDGNVLASMFGDMPQVQSAPSQSESQEQIKEQINQKDDEELEYY